MTQTQQEVDDLIDSLIIDNNTRLVDPARVRQVLKAVNARVPVSSDPSTLTAVSPLALDEFTSELSISQANESTPGYLSALDFKKFNRSAEAVEPEQFRLALKGFQKIEDVITGNSAPWPTIELNDCCWAFLSTSDMENVGQVGLFQYIDADKDDQDPTAYTPVIMSLVNIT